MAGSRGRHRRRLRARPRLGEWAVVPLALGLVFFPTARTDRLPPPITVAVEDRRAMLAPGSTLGTLRELHGITPAHGDLVDVEGLPLEESRFPGHLLVNGHRASSTTVLRHGDRVTVVNGEDRTEATTREVINIPPGQFANPQTFLGTQAGEQVIVTGQLSGKVASSVFRPVGDAKQPLEVALTFDDGPHPVWTERVLRVLDRKKAKATFYVVGYLVDRYPEIVEKLRASGMAIGNHTMNHPFRRPFGKQPREVIQTEIRAATASLAQQGVRPGTFRPPGGSWSQRVVDAAREVDQRVVLWSVDSRDWAGRTAAQIANGVLADVRPGSIILLHDGGGDRGPTLQALPRIITGLRKMDLKLVTI